MPCFIGENPRLAGENPRLARCLQPHSQKLDGAESYRLTLCEGRFER
jgi:hypothetical protein